MLPVAFRPAGCVESASRYFSRLLSTIAIWYCCRGTTVNNSPRGQMRLVPCIEVADIPAWLTAVFADRPALNIDKELANSPTLARRFDDDG